MNTSETPKKDTLEIFGITYFSVDYVSKLLGGISTQAINRWALRGEITSTKIGRNWYFTEGDIKDYLSEKTKIGVSRV